MKVAVDADKCAGHGVCVALCPHVFGLTDDGYAEAVVDVVAPGLREDVMTAASQCPEHAITVQPH